MILDCQWGFLFLLRALLVLLFLSLPARSVAELGLLVALALLLQVLVESLIAVLLAVGPQLVLVWQAGLVMLGKRPHVFFPCLRLTHRLAGLERVRLHAGVHLGEQKAEDALAVLPLKVVQVHFVREGLGRITGLLWHVRRLSASNRGTPRAKPGSIGHLGHGRVCHLPLLLLLKGILLTDFFFDLLEGLQEELLDLGPLV